jgi:hypothetical protein
MNYARLTLLSTAAAVTLVATPVLAQGYAPYQDPNAGYSNRWNSGPPIIGPAFGMLMAPFTGWTPAEDCRVERDFNGRYTALCG